MVPRNIVVLLRLGMVLGCAAAAVAMLGPFHIAQGWDKAAHVCAFYAFTLIALAALPWNRKTDIVWAALGVAACSELAQAMTGRTMSAGDLAADVAGVIAAALPVYVAEFRRAAQRDRRDETSAPRLRADRRTAL